MTPIINPWIVYALGILDTLNGFLAGINAISMILTVVLCVAYAIAGNDKYISDFWRSKFRLISSIIFTFVVIIINVAIPSKQTAINMLIAKEVTYERLDSLKTTVKDSYDYMKEDIVDILIDKNNDRDGRR